VDDIIEVINHFTCVQYMIDNIMTPLSQSFIQKLHHLLTYGTYSDRKQKLLSREYRTSSSPIGVPPSGINRALNELIKTYKKQPADFERILVVLVFDTDTGNTEILNRNILKLKRCPSVSEVVLIPQVPKLELELVRSCNIKQIKELLNSRSDSDFKRDVIRVTNLSKKLKEHNFDINLFWNKKPGSPYQNIDNQADKVKITSK